MDVIPAVVAGVDQVVITTPPRPDGSLDPVVLTAAKIAGATGVYKIGGAQAVAALAYGTESLPKVDKIVGPGNAFVARAKKWVFGDVAIDMIAGPSEICAFADNTVPPSYVAADLLSQAEHAEDATSICVTTDADYAEEVQKEIERQIPLLEREEIIRESIQANGKIIICDDEEQAIELINSIAPEHLQLMGEGAEEQVQKVKHAGAIFIGPYSSEPLGDYFAGPNHTLPTNGTARFSSPLGVYDFMKNQALFIIQKNGCLIMQIRLLPLQTRKVLQLTRMLFEFERRITMRQAEKKRQTKETSISLALNLDGEGKSELKTGVGFLDHMLTLFTKHGGLDLQVECDGDLEVDQHHTVEDIGIVLGQAFNEALGTKESIKRYATATTPMDESLSSVSIDISGRSFLVYRVDGLKDKVGSFDTELVEEFLIGFTSHAKVTLHVEVLYGSNTHHMIESMFKGLGRAIREAVSIDPTMKGVPSTKGSL